MTLTTPVPQRPDARSSRSSGGATNSAPRSAATSLLRGEQLSLRLHDCTHLVDIKAFKGKGALRAARAWCGQARERLAAVRHEMQILKERTRDVPGHSFRIEVYRNSRRQSVELRWRWRTGKHATWAVIEPAVAELPTALRTFYADLHSEMLVLNALEATDRREIDEASRVLRALEAAASAEPSLINGLGRM